MKDKSFIHRVCVCKASANPIMHKKMRGNEVKRFVPGTKSPDFERKMVIRMKNNKIKDERILQEKYKIQSAAYVWIEVALLISIIVQQFFMNAPFAQYAVEFIILIGSSLYMVICSFQKGIDIANPANQGKKELLLNAVLAGVLSVILLAFLSGNYQIESLALYFVIFVGVFFGSRLIMAGITNRKQQLLDRKLDEEDRK